MKNQVITEVSHVTSIAGVAKFRTPDGVLHELQVGDILQPGMEVILVDASNFAFEKGLPDAIQAPDLPADQQPSMPAMGAAAGDQTIAQINALQQAILAGQDPTQAFEAAAAGIPADAGGTGAGSGNSGFVSIVRTGGSTIAEAGFDTTALASDPLLQVADPVAPTVALINDPTVVVADTNTIEEDTVATGNVLANDSDTDDILSVASFLVDGVIYVPGQTAELPNVGTLIINADGSYVFTPEPNWSGTVPEIAYTTNTGSSSTLNIEVAAINDNPVIVDENGAPMGADMSVTTKEDTPVSGILLAIDPDNDTLTFVKGSDPSNGTVIVNPDGSWTYTPNSNYNGSDSFTALVNDGQGGTDTIVVNIGVTPVNDNPDAVNDSPEANPDALSTKEDIPLTILPAALLANDSDVDGDSLNIMSVQDAVNGSVSLVNGNVVFTPDADYHGPASFTYTISDGQGGSDTAVVNIEVTPVNDAPTTTAVTLTAIAEDSGARVITQSELLGNAADIEGNTLVANGLTISNGHGTLEDNGDGSWTYTPALNDDSQVSFSYTITDNGTTNGAADPKSVAGSATLDITPVNDAPTTTAVTLTAIAEDSGARVITQSELLGNAADIEGNTLVANGLTISNGHGTLEDNGDGSWTYTPALNDDSQVSFSYTITDNGTTNGAADPKSVAGSATLDITPVNDAPTTTAVTLTAIAEDSGARVITQSELLGNAADIEGNTLVANGLTISNGHGTLEDNGDGSWTYTPALNDDSQVSFSYTITDNGTTNGAADPKSVAGSATLDITPVNDAPTTTAVTLTAIAEDSGARVITQSELLGNAADIEGNTLVANGLTISNGHGTLEDNGDGSWTYTPALNDDSQVSFSYTITDNGTTNGAADPKSVAGSATLDITPVNDAPTTTAVTLTAIAEDSGARVITQSELLGNAADIEGNTLVANGLTISNGHGTLEDNGDGSWTYTPALNDDSQVSFSYTITDNGTTNGAADPKSVAGSATLDITPVNDAPTTTAVTLTAIAEDSGARVITQSELLGNAADIEGNTLVANGLTISNGHGTLEDNGDGSWTYTPALNDDSQVSFSYTITDNGTTNGAADPKSVAGSATLDITPVNDAPTTTAVTLTAIAEDSGARVITQSELLGNAADIEGNTLVANGLTISNGHGTLEDNGDGSWTYTPALNDDSQVSFSYTITDNGTTNGAADPKSVAGSATLDITPVNDAPTTTAVTLTAIAEDSGARVITQSELLGNAADIEGNTLVANGLTISNGHGTLEDNGDGSWTYTPALNDDSQVSFSYTITDNGTTNGVADPKSVAGSATLDITSVADAPELIVSVIKGEEQPGIVYPAPAFNNHLNAGTTTGNIMFAGYTKTAAIDIKSYKTDVDDGRIVFLRDGVVIKEVLIDSILPNANNAPTHLVLNTDEYFNTIRVENYATSADSNAEFKVDSVSFITNLTFNYTLNIAAELTDSSETLGPVMIGQAQLSLLGATLYANGVLVSDVDSDGYLSVALSDAVAIKTDHNLTVDEINSITSSITSTTADGSDSATTTTTALLDIAGTSGDDVIPGSIGDDMIHGEDGNDTITGNQGDDILTGGDGIDTFTWAANDITGGHYVDTITDFSISSSAGDKLDLSDVLDVGDTYAIVQDPNNTANAMLTVTKVGSTTPDMTIILEDHGGDALDDLQAYLSHDENLIK